MKKFALFIAVLVVIGFALRARRKPEIKSLPEEAISTPAPSPVSPIPSPSSTTPSDGPSPENPPVEIPSGAAPTFNEELFVLPPSIYPFDSQIPLRDVPAPLLTDGKFTPPLLEIPELPILPKDAPVKIEDSEKIEITP